MDLSKKIRNGSVQKLNGSMLGINKVGKGSFYRIKTSDEQYKENYNKIFRKNKCSQHSMK
tara:strand:+ start:294 stop:473 length:180 start_codon:yes stop_codon:yes gene_type:complete